MMVCAQLVAFNSVSQSREQRRERRERKREKEERRTEEWRVEQMKAGLGSSNQANGTHRLVNDDILHKYGANGTGEKGKAQSSIKDDSEGTEDEIIL